MDPAWFEGWIRPTGWTTIPTALSRSWR